jgi:hypothetical protein
VALELTKLVDVGRGVDGVPLRHISNRQHTRYTHATTANKCEQPMNTDATKFGTRTYQSTYYWGN